MVIVNYALLHAVLQGKLLSLLSGASKTEKSLPTTCI